MLTVILTGGLSRRMGTDKSVLPVGDTTLAFFLAKKYACLGPVCFCVDRPGRFPTAPYGELTDAYPGCGPLNGLVSAFRQTPEELVFLTAVDMPCASAAAVQALREAMGEAEACLYKGEPLFGLYRRSCLAAAERCLREGKNSFRDFLPLVNARLLPVEEGPDLRNLNTPEEYNAYLSLLK